MYYDIARLVFSLNFCWKRYNINFKLHSVVKVCFPHFIFIFYFPKTKMKIKCLKICSYTIFKARTLRKNIRTRIRKQKHVHINIQYINMYRVRHVLYTQQFCSEHF